MKIGFACVYMLPVEKETAETKREQKTYRLSDTTVQWLNANPDKAEDRLWEILDNNTKSLRKLVTMISELPEPLRMVRIGSGVCPAYTHDSWSWFYKQPDVVAFLEKRLGFIGRIAKRAGTKLSFHPGQYTVLASHKPDIVTKSIEEIEYHVDLCRYLGFARKRLDMKVNVHLSGKGGASEFLRSYKRLSPDARRVLTLENDEFSSSLDDLIPLRKKVGIVLDIHHHWVNTRGEYISHKDPRLDYVLESWCGKRPTLHYSCSREAYIGHLSRIKRPEFSELDEPASRLRSHSMLYPNLALNRWALSFLPQFDIMCEAKAKNIASFQLYSLAKNINLL